MWRWSRVGGELRTAINHDCSLNTIVFEIYKYMSEMLDFTPKLINHPGVSGPLREQTLDEFLTPLAADHLARRQLAELRRMATDGKKAASQLMDLLDRNKALEAEVTQLKGRWHTQAATGLMESGPDQPEACAPVSTMDPAKLHCPYCSKDISMLPGPWKLHMMRKHPDKAFVSPYSSPPV
jgi:hypothetical protein